MCLWSLSLPYALLTPALLVTLLSFLLLLVILVLPLLQQALHSDWEDPQGLHFFNYMSQGKARLVYMCVHVLIPHLCYRPYLFHPTFTFFYRLPNSPLWPPDTKN